MQTIDMYEIFDCRTGKVCEVAAGPDMARTRAAVMGAGIDFDRAQSAFYIARLYDSRTIYMDKPFASQGAAQNACDMLNMADDYSTYVVVQNSNYGKL